MFWKRITAWFVGGALLLAVSQPPHAAPKPETIRVPAGTKVYCELQERVISKKKQNRVGQPVEVRVWRDVEVEGRVVIPKGTTVRAKIDEIKSAKVAGISGKLGISASYLLREDGTTVALSGGLGTKGKGSVASTVLLAAVLAWPLIFIPGSKAKLERGTLFDAYTDESFEVGLADTVATTSLDGHEGIGVEVLYAELEGKAKIRALPLTVRVCDGELPEDLVVDRINGVEIKRPISVAIDDHRQVDGCHQCSASVRFKPVAKRFNPGINSFDVAYHNAGERVGAEVVLDLQF